MRILLLLSFAACNPPAASPPRELALHHVTDPDAVVAVTDAVTTLDVRLEATPRAADRLRARIETVEALRPAVRKHGARALAEVRNLVFSGAAYDRDVAIAEREAVQP